MSSDDDVAVLDERPVKRACHSVRVTKSVPLLLATPSGQLLSGRRA